MIDLPNMKPRDRFHSAVNHEEPDRVPLDLWITPQAYENLRDYLGFTAPEDQEWGIMSTWNISEELLNRLHIDFRRLSPSLPICTFITFNPS